MTIKYSELKLHNELLPVNNLSFPWKLADKVACHHWYCQSGSIQMKICVSLGGMLVADSFKNHAKNTMNILIIQNSLACKIQWNTRNVKMI